MERDKLLEISKGGRLQYDSSDIESDSARIDQIEEELKRSVFKEKKRSKTAALGKVLLKNYAELQTNWNKEKLYKATKQLKDGWDESIAKAQERGVSTEDLFKMVHDESTYAGLLSQFDEATAGLTGGDRKEALADFKEYQKIAQRKIRRQAAVEQLKVRRKKAERGLEDLRIAVIEDKISDEAIQNRFSSLVKNLGFSESDREVYNEAARDAIKRGYLDRSISRLNEAEAKKQLQINKTKLTAREYSAYSRSISQIPERVNQKGDAIIDNQDMEARGLYATQHKNSMYARIFALEEGRMLAGFAKNGRVSLPTKQDYIDIAFKATAGKSRAEQNKAIARAEKAYESWKKYANENKREILVKRINKKEWDNLPEEVKYNATGQSFDTMQERRTVGQQALLAYKANNFVGFRNELLRMSGGDQAVVERKLKEALMQLRKDNPKANKDAGGSFIDMLEVEINNPGAIKFNKNAIERELERNMAIPKYADLDDAYNLDNDLAELGNRMENLVGSMPGGPAIMRTLALQARAFARTAPLDEDSETPPEKQRKILFADKLKELYGETLNNEKLLGDRGKWTQMEGAGMNGRTFLFDNAAIGADAQRNFNVQEMADAIKNGDVLHTGILAAGYLDKNIEKSFLQRNPKTNAIELWGEIVDETTGESQQVHLTDSNGIGLTTTDQAIAVYGAAAFNQNSIFKAALHRPYDRKLRLGMGDIVDTVTKGSTSALKKQDADTVATLKYVNGGNNPSGILPKGLHIKGKDYSTAPIKEQLRVVKGVEKQITDFIKGRGWFGLSNVVDAAMDFRSPDDIDPRIPKIITMMALKKDSKIMEANGELNKENTERIYAMLDKLYQPNLLSQFESPFAEPGTPKAGDLLRTKLDPQSGIPRDEVKEELMSLLYAIRAIKFSDSDLKLTYMSQLYMSNEEIDAYNDSRVRAFHNGAYSILHKGFNQNGYNQIGGKWSYRIPRQDLEEGYPFKVKTDKRQIGVEPYSWPKVGSNK